MAATTKRSRFTTVAETAAEAAKAEMQQEVANKRIVSEAPVPSPGGRIIDAMPYVTQTFDRGQEASFLADINDHPERYLKNPEPGWRYAWPDTKDPTTHQHIRSQRWQVVHEDDVLDNADAPFMTHEGPSKMSGWRRHILVRMRPDVYEKMYKAREALSFSQLASSRQSFQESVESMSGGKASGRVANPEHEITETLV